ncbi:MAG TPA: DNA-binding protein, partial [Acerihabitans sp.]
MTNTTLTGLALPAKHEIETATRGQRALAAFLSTKLETQQILIKDADDVSHQIELPTAALTLLMNVLGELAEGNAVQVV